MTTTLDIDEVTAFATAVRRELSDLGPDTLDDLTDGLEADLADKLADGEPLGDPAAYAAELRAAAGLAIATRPSISDTVRASMAELRSRVARVTSHPVVAALVSFLVALRPLWWVIRGWALFYILAGFTPVPQNAFDPWLLGALLLLSIQWGRGRWLPWKWSRAAVIALSIVAALTVPTLIPATLDKMTFIDRMNPNDYISDGILLDKQQVTNIFAYGADGQLLTDVRLFDQDGNPLSVVPDSWGQQVAWDEGDDSTVRVPSDQVAGSLGWNVYPLNRILYEDVTDTDSVPSWAKRIPATAPFETVQQLLGYEAPAAPTAPAEDTPAEK